MEKVSIIEKADMKRITQWFGNARCGALTQSMMPAFLAAVMAYDKPEFSMVLSMLAVIGVAMAHMGFNLLDDYFDYCSHQTGYRDMLNRAGFRAYTEKCPYIQNGSASMDDLKKAVLCFGMTAVLCGGIIFVKRGEMILILAAVGGVLGYFYSGWPIRLSYHGLGEPVIGVVFGPLNMMGVHAASCGELDDSVLVIGCVLGILVTNILFAHSILDYTADQSVGKKTMAAWFPTSKTQWKTFAFFNFLPYLIVGGAVLSHMLGCWYLLALFVMPWSVALCCSMAQYIKHPQETPRWKNWYGPVANWDRIQEAGVDWFLGRWLLARNIVAYFSVACIIANLISRWR